MHKLLLIGLLVAGVAWPACAIWPFGGDDKAPSKYVKATNAPPVKAAPLAGAAKPAPGASASAREPVPMNAVPAAETTSRVSRLTFVDPLREQQFLSLVSSRRLAKQAIVVLSRLGGEKRVEVSTFSDQLQVDFGVNPEDTYEYDPVSNVMYQVIQPAGTGAVKATRSAELPRRQMWTMQDPKKEQEFVRLVASKNLSRRELRMIDLMLQEKMTELKAIEERLQKEFEIDPQKNYEYDAARKTVYEIIAPAGSATRPAKP